MKSWIVLLLVGLIPGLVVSAGMVAWSFLLTGDWPPQFLLIAGSLGGMLSPLLWGSIRWICGRQSEANEVR